MNGSAPNSPLDRVEEIGARTRHPLAASAVGAPAGTCQAAAKAAEMIEANHVHVSQQSAQPVDAPAIAGPAKRLPVVNRIAPELSLRAEIIGRHSGDEARPVLLVQQKQFRVGPHVARIGRNEKWQVADQAHALWLRAYCFRRSAWRNNRNCAKRTRSIWSASSCRALRQGRRVALDQLRRPLQIIGAVVPGLQRSEQSVIFQPVRLVMAELLVSAVADLSARRRRSWSRPCSSSRA